MKKILRLFLITACCFCSCHLIAKTITITKNTPYIGLYNGKPYYILLSTDKLAVNSGDAIRWSGGGTSYGQATTVALSTLNKEYYYYVVTKSYSYYIYVVDLDNSQSGSTCSITPKTIVLWTKGPVVSRWEKSYDGGSSWTIINNTSYHYDESNPAAGTAMYRVLGTDNTYSDVVTITYVDAVPETIQALPATNTKTVDEIITFTADVEDNGYSYQWKKGGTDISGATDRTYTISTIKSSHAGNYTCEVSNGCNSVTTTTAALSVNKCAQVIDFPEIPVQTYSAGLTYTLPKTTDKGLTITYQSMNTSVATVSGNVLTIKAPGTAIISATQVGDADYLEATQVSRTLTVNKRSQTITFDELPVKTYEDLPFTLPQKTDEGLTISYTSTNTSVATVSGNTVTILKPGTTDIIASQAGDATHYAAAEVSQTLTVNKAVQEISFGSLASKTYGDKPFELNKVTNKNLTISYTSSDASIASIENNVVTINKPGTVTITANQAGNAYYLAAEPVAQTLTINKANQSINFPALESRAYDSGDFELPKLTDKGEMISYASSKQDVATITDNIVHITGAGTTEITASQDGNEYYNAAPSVSQSLTITKATQTINFPELPACVFGQDSVTLEATVNSGLEIAYESSDYSVATVNGNKLAIIGAGTCHITASVAGNKNYYTATPVERTLVVNKAQSVLTFEPFEGEYTYGDAPIALTAYGSSDKIVFTSSNPSKLLIAGTNAIIQGAGHYTITASIAEDANHLPVSVSQEITINKAALTLTANNASRKYGENNPIFSYSFKGFVNGDAKTDLTANVEIATNANINSPVGAYEIVATATADDNYNITCKKGVLTVEKAPLTISTQGAREYGENNPDFVFSYEGFKNNENSSVLTAQPVAYTTAKKSSPAGTYPIYISGASATNYEIAYEEGVLTVTKAPLTITALNTTRKRTHENPTFELSFDGFKLEDTQADLEKLPTIQCLADANSPAGSYPIVLLDDGYDTTYAYTLVNGVLTVEKLTYTITVLSQDETMGQTFGSGTYAEGEEILIYAAPAQHYHFVKWDDDNTEISRNILVSEDATYTAIFAVNQYTITWKQDDGTLIDQTVVEYGQMPTHADPSKAATVEFTYSFAGWTPEIVAAAGNATYTATYNSTRNKYTITWKQDDGTLIDQTVVEYGQVPTHTTPTKLATAEFEYNFAGWTPQVVAVKGDATYTATYSSEKRKYTITFLNDDNSVLCADKWEYGATPYCEEPTKADDDQYTYTFAGWTPEIVAVVEEATYTATYTATAKPEGIEDVIGSESPRKVMIDGVFFILRGNRIYTLQGQEVR